MVNLHDTLLDEEIKYLEQFFRLHGEEFRAYNLEGTWKGNRMSSYAYSQSFNVGSDVVDPTRFRIGTLKFFDDYGMQHKALRDVGSPLIIFSFGAGKGFLPWAWLGCQREIVQGLSNV